MNTEKIQTVDNNTACVNASEQNHPTWYNIKYVLVGIIFGIGGLIFGFGWAITGACPGPLYAHIGAGFYAIAVVILSAIAGTWTYGYFKEKLPH